MARRGQADRAEITPDAIYNSNLVSRFINSVMRDGKKSTAESIFYGAMDEIQEQTGEDPMKLFKDAVDNTKPSVEVKSRRVGGSTYQVPVEVNPKRKVALAMRWIIASARRRGETRMKLRLAGELMDAANNQGGAVKRKNEVHRMADANKAFAHFRW